MRDMQYESYVRKFKFGPGLRLTYNKRLKTPEEITEERKNKRMDVYNNSVLVGKCERRGRKWYCYVELTRDSAYSILPKYGDITTNMDISNKLDGNLVVDYVRRETPHIVLRDYVFLLENGIYYLRWTYHRRGYFLTNEVHAEITNISKLIFDLKVTTRL